MIARLIDKGPNSPAPAHGCLRRVHVADSPRAGGRLLGLAGALVAGLAAVAAAAAPPPTATERGAPRPSRKAAFALDGSVMSGIWLDGGRVLLLHSFGPYRLARVLPDGRAEPAVTFPTEEHPEFLPSWPIAAGPDGGVWLATGHAILRLDRSLHEEGFVDLRKLSFPDCQSLVGLVQPQVMPGAVVGLAACTQPGTPGFPVFGYAHLQLEPTPVLTPLRALAEATNEGGLAWLVPALAQVDGEVFALVFEGGPHLERVFPGTHRLRSFPPGFAEVPVIPRRGSNPQLECARRFEAASMAAGLYAEGDRLYLLTRRPAGDATAWSLHRIDATRDTLEATIPLPTTAPHLVVVPGPREWAFVEQEVNVVTNRGKRTRRILFIPARELRRAPRTND